ncbi:MAG: glycosyltransferase family 2 protein [Candidatus Margulisiibacteriota bacterium]
MEKLEANLNKVAVIVLNWNGWQDTIACLDSIYKINYPNYQVIVVDNGSTDGSVEKIRNWAEKNALSQLKIIELKKNLGYGAGNNFGLRYALENGFAYAWLLNNDIIVDREALIELVKRIQEKPSAGICGSTILHYDQPNKTCSIGGTYDKWIAQGGGVEQDKLFDIKRIERYQKMERKIKYIQGASVLVSRKFLMDVGLISEEYFLFFEEIDWITRAKGRYSLAYAPKSIVYHKGSASIKRKEKDEGHSGHYFSYLGDLYTTRNRLLFTTKYYPYALPFVYLSILGYILDRIRVGAWANVGIMSKETKDHFFSLFKRR